MDSIRLKQLLKLFLRISPEMLCMICVDQSIMPNVCKKRTICKSNEVNNTAKDIGIGFCKNYLLEL